MAPFSDKARAFTLIEILVSITVIAVLLSLALPSLAQARRRADSIQCLSSLGSLHSFIAVFAEQHNKGNWPNALEPQTEYGHWVLGDTETITTRTMDQTDGWVGPLAAKGYVSANAEEVAQYACRAVQRKLPKETFVHNPQLNAEASYLYSTALFTAADLWDPAFPTRRLRADDFRRSVGLHEITFPSAKVAFLETGDHHGSGRWISEFSKAGQGRMNVLCADGHSATVDPFSHEPPLPAPWSNNETFVRLPNALPFCASAGGYRGRDLR